MPAYFVLEEIVKTLLQNGVDGNKKDNRGRTALSWAAEHGHEKVVELLLDIGTDPNQEDDLYNTPLVWAVPNGHPSVVKLLLDRNGGTCWADYAAEVRLICEAHKGHEDAVESLLKQGTKPDCMIGEFTPAPLSSGCPNENPLQTLPVLIKFSSKTPAPCNSAFASYLRSMPKSSPISAPLRQALIECFREITCLVRPELRHQLVLVGGAASIAHNSVLYTEEVDVAAPSDVIHDIFKVVIDGALNFSLEPDDMITFDGGLSISVRIDLIQIGDAIERIHAMEPFFEGSVASISELLRLRAVTVVERGSDGEADDFRWLLTEVAKAGQLMLGLSQEELDYIREAGRLCLGRLGRLDL